MAWTASAMFQAWPQMLLEHSVTEAQGYHGIETDVIKAALFNDSITPDKDAAVALTGFDAASSAWDNANEVSDGTNWDAGGEPLTGKAVTDGGSGITQFDATDTPQSGASTTLASVFGCLVYNDDITGGTVVDQGISYHYFGGSQSVTAGTFTIVWHANGLFRITV